MTKESLKVGDRVCWYYTQRSTGTVLSFPSDRYVCVRPDIWEGTAISLRKEAVRRLRPKKKPMRVERRVLWSSHEDYPVYPVLLRDDDKIMDELEGKTGVMTFVEDSK